MTYEREVAMALVIALTVGSATIANRRYRWSAGMALVYGLTILVVYALLTYAFSADLPGARRWLPALVVLVGIVTTIGLCERFWRSYQVIQTRLIQAEKVGSLARLVAGIAHELNNPLGAVQSGQDVIQRATHRLRESASGETRVLDALEAAVTSSTEATARMGDLVQRLVAFSNLDQADIRPVNLNEALRTTLDLMSVQIPARIDVSTDLVDLPPVLCSPDRVNQVLLNILLNAIEAIEYQGSIQIATRLDNGRVVIEIADSGMGIADEDMPRIFDPGFTTKHAGIGTGLGLAICYQTVQEHGGKIDVTSTPDAGTRVAIHLPLGGTT